MRKSSAGGRWEILQIEGAREERREQTHFFSGGCWLHWLAEAIPLLLERSASSGSWSSARLWCAIECVETLVSLGPDGWLTQALVWAPPQRSLSVLVCSGRALLAVAQLRSTPYG